jgi:hypothetical protein
MARSIHRLSARTVASLTDTGYHADGGGLYLQISPTGTKSWIFRFTRARAGDGARLPAQHLVGCGAE